MNPQDNNIGIAWIDKNRLPIWAVFLFVRPMKASLSAVGGLFVADKIMEQFDGKGIKNLFFYVALVFGSTYAFNFFVNAAELVARMDWIGKNQNEQSK